MKKNLVALCLLSLSSPLFAQNLILPFKYAEELTPAYNSAGSVVYPGAAAGIGTNTELNVHPVQTLFVAPKRSKVQLGAIVRSPGANCQAFEKDKLVETSLSDVYANKVKMLSEDDAFLLELKDAAREANRSCLDAMKKADTNKAQLCANAAELRKMEADVTKESVLPQLTALNDIRDMVSKRIADYGDQYGGYAGAIVDLFSPEEIAEVESANPNHDVKVVPIKKVFFSFNAGIEAQAALGQSIPRKTALGYYLDGQSTTTSANGGTKEAVTRLASGQSTALGINLSVIGACADTDLRTAKFSYSYDTFGYVRGEVSYNLWQYYTRLEERKTKKGFFTSSDSHKVFEDTQNGDDLKVVAFGTDENLKSEMKDRMVTMLETKILGQMATRETPNVEVPDLKAPESGASTTGKILTEKCPNQYCQIAGYALLALDSIFGKGTTRAEAEIRWNKKVNETWSETTIHEADDGASTAAIEFKAI